MIDGACMCAAQIQEVLLLANVVFSAVLSGLGRIAGAAVGLFDRLPRNERFELSEDGESLYLDNERYKFVGFSPDGSYITVSGEKAVKGKRLGRVMYNSEYRVNELVTALDSYVLLSGVGDYGEVYALVS